MNFFELHSSVRVVHLKDWLDWAGGKYNNIFVALPMIQRGSVWKPQQIIDLWDSLLQGMPIGSMMVSELNAGMMVRRPGKHESETVPAGGALGLIDGHQRTLAMLIAWQRAEGVDMDRRVWVDFADEPLPGHGLRLRVTTKNQPFGFQRNGDSSKLSLNDRRQAREAFNALGGLDKENRIKPELSTAWPFSHSPGLPVDLQRLVSLWREEGNSEFWRFEVMKSLQGHDGITFDRSTQQWRKINVWNTLSEAQQSEVGNRVAVLDTALTRLFGLEIPLIRVDDRFFETQGTANNDPPLAVLFKRIGTNGTPLSDADYVYSVIKHLRPETYDLVETLHHKGNVASLLMATDLVMSAVRLATVTWKPDDDKPVSDMENPTKQEFHRLLQRGDFIKESFLPLIQGDQYDAEIARYFDDVQNMLSYRTGPDVGLPKQAFPLLKRPLVQVLLRLAQVGYLKNREDRERRYDVMRLVLSWLVATTDPSKASRLAYEVIKNEHASGAMLGQAIHNRLLADGAAVRLATPADIEKRPGLAFSASTSLLRGESRFDARQQGDESNQAVYSFYRNHWWRPWTHQHPILLWLQREMVAQCLDTETDPMAGKDEDTPYDYDHILPYSHWGYWTGVKWGDRLPDFADTPKQIWVVGNGIGNVRVWASSLNRSDGDAPPIHKLGLDVLDHGCRDLLEYSAIRSEQQHISGWREASGYAKHRSWTKERTSAFQRVVEERTFYLYEHYFEELEFFKWYEDSAP